jgi:ABC-type transport system involved in Fe-S cluster assembly fused permease/ATPase subunit
MILVLKEGKIVQQGTHMELIQEPGVYRDLYQAQDF